MKMSVVDIIADARSAWIDPDPGFITNTETLRWFNIAQQDFITKTKCLTSVWSLSTVADQQEYTWDATQLIVQIQDVLLVGKDIFPVTEGELTNYDRNWRQEAGGSTGEPEWYYVDYKANKFGLYVCPDAVYAVKVNHTSQPTILALAVGELPVAFPDISSQFHHMLIPFVEYMGHKKNRDANTASTAWRAYAGFIRDAKNLVTDSQPDRTRCMRGPEYVMRRTHPNYPQLPRSYSRWPY